MSAPTTACDYSIRVYKQYFNFAASHFLVFADGTREPLHGHNYRVEVRGDSRELKGDMVFDFLHLKPLVRQVCDSLDHRLLIPMENPFLEYHEEAGQLHLQTADGGRFSIPRGDVLLLPLPNTSAERLAMYIAHNVHALVRERYGYVFAKLEVEVEETPGQSAVYVYQYCEA